MRHPLQVDYPGLRHDNMRFRSGGHESCRYVSQCAVNRRRQPWQIPRVVMPDAVDEKGRRSVYPAADTAEEMLAHSGCVDTVSQLALDSFCVESKQRCVASQLDILERILVLEQDIVHFPEGALRARGLGHFRRMLGVRMNLRERKVPKYKAQLIAEPALHLFHDRIRASAIRTLEIPIFN